MIQKGSGVRRFDLVVRSGMVEGFLYDRGAMHALPRYSETIVAKGHNP